MKKLILLLALAGMAFAWTNDALPEVLDAQYDYSACNVQFAKDFVEMREACAETHGETVFDSSDYISDLDDSLADVKDAADDGDGLQFNGAMWTLRAEMLSLGAAVVGDALTNKSADFRGCVLGGTDELDDALESCRSDAFQKGKTAATDYVNNELEYANGQIDDLDGLGADTSGMQTVVDQGEALVDDIGPAFDSEDPAEVSKVYQRHSRLVLLFRLEKMVAVMDYAEPIIEAGSNRNKDELLDDMADLRGDTVDLLDECEYSETVGSDYGLKNLGCWSEGLALMGRFNSLQALYLGGV